MSQHKVTRARQRRKEDLVYIMSDKCCLCGYNNCIAALEFHHKDESLKTYTLSDGNCRSIESDLTELRKCILVCSNCHREIHSGMHESSITISTFNEERAKEILSRLQSQPKVRQCSACSETISRTNKTGLCWKCFQLTNVNPDKPNRETLKDLIRTVSFLELGRQFRISDNGIRKWCDSYGLPRTKKAIIALSNEEWEKI